jgi:hypothetical protein
MRIKAEPPRTLRSVSNLVVHATLCGASGLNSDMPLPPCQEVRNGDKNITSGTPEVFYDVVLGPLVSYSNLVYRIDVLDQLQVCTPENFFLPLSSAIEPGHYSALGEDDQKNWVLTQSPRLLGRYGSYLPCIRLPIGLLRRRVFQTPESQPSE